MKPVPETIMIYYDSNGVETSRVDCNTGKVINESIDLEKSECRGHDPNSLMLRLKFPSTLVKSNSKNG